MSKWFESGNLANYAKTALLQAQKRIDQVLDIKEEDIISGGQTPTSSSSAAQSQASSAATTINNLFSASLSKLGGGGGGETLTKSKLSSSSISSMTSKNKTAAGEEETESFFSAFLNSSSSNSTSTTTTAMNNSTSASQVANLSTFQPSGDDMEESNTASITSSTATIDEKINPPTTTKERKPKSTKMDLDKQNWIQNYVDKSVPNTDTKSDKKKEEKQRRSTSSSTTLVSAESTTTTTATTTTANPEIEEADIATKSVIIESSQLEENDSEKQLSPRGDLLTDECSSSTLILTARDQTSTSSMNNKSSSSQAQTSSMTDMDFVKIEGNASTSKENAQNGGSGGGSGNNAGGGSISGNASSNEEGEGLETCASSDIEVLSLPSTSGDQFLLHKSSGTIARVPSLASMAASSVKSGDGDGPKKSAKDNSEGSILKVNKSNSNVKQIFVKSPPPPPPPTVVATNNSSQNLQQQLQLQIASSAADGSSSSLPTPTVIKPGFDITTISPGDAASGTSTSAVNDIDPSIKNILDAREAHVLKLNRQNVSLQEENDNLMNEIEKLKYEFNDKFVLQKRVLSELQSKLDQSNSEREMLKRANAEIQRELADLKSNVSEKDSQIEQLTQEGLKLSKQELTQSNIIKKLRTKEKETEEVLNILKNDYQKSQKELDELKGVLDAKEEAETKNLDAFKKLEKTALALEKEMLNTKSLLEDSEEKVRSLESTLANSYKELSELRKSNVEKESRINETTSSIETQLREEVRTAVEKEKSAWAKKQEALRWEIESLRQDVTRVEQQHAIREDMLRKEIADLQQQLRDAEMRNNELSQNISSATKPLLRQIENLQASHSSQIELLENSERTLIQRLKETQANLCEASERSRQNQEQLLDLTQQCKLNEAQLTTLKLEKSKLISEYQLMKTTLENYENEKLEKEAQNRALITSLNQQIETLTREKKYLESQLEIVKTQAENDSKKFQALLTDVNREKEQQMQQMKQQQQQTQLQMSQSKDGMATPMSSQESPNLSRFSSFFEAKNELRSSFDFSSHPPSALNTLELLQSRLKQKEGEVIHLQKEVENLERVRESMARELVNLSDKLESYKEYEELQDKYDKLVIQHNALLTLLGEKTEENEELRMDLQDVKEMYKVQIEELLKNQRT